MFSALADLADRRPRRVIAVAVALAVTAGALGGSVAKRLDPYGAEDPATDSIHASDRLERAAGIQADPGIVALVQTPSGVDSPVARAKVTRIAAVIRRDSAVGRVTTFYDSHQSAMVSRDRRSTYVLGNFRPVPDKAVERAAKRLDARLGSEPGVKLGGGGVAFVQVNAQVESDLKRAELMAFPLLFLLTFLVFRSLVAAALPLLVGGLSIVGSFLALRLYTELGSVSVFALNLSTGLGLGLAIDYSLFVVSRYREEIARVGPGREALQRTMATAGRTVLFSSMTVAAALASLLVFPQRFLYSMGLGGATVALIACAVSLVVLPAVLSLLGTRVNSMAPAWLQRAAEREARPAASGAWYRLSLFVTRRPATIAVVGAALLIGLGIPSLGMRFTSIDATVLPHDKSGWRVDQALRSDFPPNRTTPIVLAVDTSGARSPAAAATEAATVARAVRGLPGVAEVAPPQPLGRGTALVQVTSRDGVFSGASQDLVRRIRALPAAASANVGGQTAEFVDTKASLRSHLPLALAIVALGTLTILFLMTGSVVLPVKTLIMNLLTLSASFGILVTVFQHGRLEGFLAYTSQGAIESTMPVFLFAVAFGLSTDYGVFMLARIKEARDGGASDSEAVAMGLERSGRIVTAAAVLFAVAMFVFATSKIIFIKENFIGVAVAVLIDATIVRALLVPSLMELLGRRNWWAPAPLRKLHRRFGISEDGGARTEGAGA